MDSKDLLLDSLDERGAKYQERLRLCREEFSEDAVHNLRTSIRRLLATLEVIANFTAKSRAAKLSQSLKKQLDNLDSLRDLQVMLEEISERIDALPEVKPFQDHLEEREKEKQDEAEKYVEDVKLDAITRKLIKLYEAVEDLPPEELEDKLPQAVDKAYLTVMQRYGEIDPAQLASIHRLRVAFKKFRYMVESIYPCLPGFPESNLKRMHDYQTQMGHIHDLQVIMEALKEFASDNNSSYPPAVQRFYEQLLAEALSDYLKSKEDVLTFWRANPLQSFPWGQDRKKNKHREQLS